MVRSSITALMISSLLIGLPGCATGLLNFSDTETFGDRFTRLMGNDKRREKEEDNDFDTSTKIETPLLRTMISVTGNNMVALRGVGLVTGLDGTGGDPPPSHLRKQLMDEMTKMKIPNPSRILSDRNTALVIVTAYLPPMVREGQTFDVRVALPPNSTATSLKGGMLLETRLSEERAVAGRGNLKGHQYAVAHGAILTALGDGGKANQAMLRRGSIPGGAHSKTERNLEVILRNEHRGLKAAKGVETAISTRLHDYSPTGKRISMAEAKTDLMIELMVHPTYRNNFPRYQQMIRSIAYKETDIARRLRMQRLKDDIMLPEKSAVAALQLEAIGVDGIPFLKEALNAPNAESRFHAAQSLAYLEDSSGVEILKQAALDEPAFRVYALAALSVIDDADSIVALRELLKADNLETRYGAVRALKENSSHDSALGTTDLPGQFVLHAIDGGSPAVHVVRYRAPEVVIFGSRQELRLPTVLNAGNRIRVIGKAGEKTVTITRYHLNKPEERRQVSTNLVEILLTLAELGARYPDIVQLLLEADEQANLVGDFGIDRLPQAGRSFSRFGSESRDAKIGTPSLTPELFERLDESEQYQPEEESPLTRMFGNADMDMPEEADDSQTASLSDQSETDVEAIDADMIRQLNLSDEANDEMSEQTSDESMESDEFVIEQTEFKEPLGARLKRTLLGPFRSGE